MILDQRLLLLADAAEALSIATRAFLEELAAVAQAIAEDIARSRALEDLQRALRPLRPSLIELGEGLAQARVDVLADQRALERARRLEAPRPLRAQLAALRAPVRLTVRRAPRRGPHRSRALLGRAHPLNRSL